MGEGGGDEEGVGEGGGEGGGGYMKTRGFSFDSVVWSQSRFHKEPAGAGAGAGAGGGARGAGAGAGTGADTCWPAVSAGAQHDRKAGLATLSPGLNSPGNGQPS